MEEFMDILYVTPAFHPAWEYGGIIPASFQLLSELTKKGVDVTVFTTDAFNQKERIHDNYTDYNGVKVYRFPNLSNSLAWNRIFFPKTFDFKTGDKRFDIVHMIDYRFVPNLFMHESIKNKNIPYILTPLNPFNNINFGKKYLKHFFDKVLGKTLLRDAKILIAQSKSEAYSYQNLGMPAEQIEIIPNGINIGELRTFIQKGTFRRTYGIPSDKKIILFLGRIDYVKGLDLLIYAYYKLKKCDYHKDAMLVIVGPDTGYKNNLVKIIEYLGIREHVLFTGPLIGSMKLSAYHDSDIYVLPSRYEEFGIAPLEAYACGKPVIITEECGVNYWMKDHFSKVVKPNADDLSNAISFLLQNMDCDERINLEERLCYLESMFSWKTVVSQTLKVYERVLV